jgi:GntR family transcriptional repressor for pyruvate dehydrogenase complex
MPVLSKPLPGRRLYQQVAEQLRQLIQTRQYPVGSRLPPERDLAQSLGVSRPSLREALIALEISGHVEIRGGSGLYACLPAGPVAPAAVAGLGESPSEVMQARAMLESAVVMLAAARATPAVISRLRECLDGMRMDLANKRVPVDNDRAFHIAIAEMTGNSVLVRIVSELFDDRHSPLTSHVSVRAESLRTWLAAVDEHEIVLRAIEAREPQAAAAAMAMHLRASEVRWLGT